jgi:hypothetical protein
MANATKFVWAEDNPDLAADADLTWTQGTIDVGFQATDIVWDGSTSQFVAVGNSGKVFVASLATVLASGSWTARSQISANNIQSVASDGKGTMVAAGVGNLLAISTDAFETFTPQDVRFNGLSEPNGVNFDMVTWAQDRFVLYTGNTGYLYTSADGATWTCAGTPITYYNNFETTATMLDMANSKFMFSAYAGTCLWSSDDLTSFTMERPCDSSATPSLAIIQSAGERGFGKNVVNRGRHGFSVV